MQGQTKENMIQFLPLFLRSKAWRSSQFKLLGYQYLNLKILQYLPLLVHIHSNKYYDL